MLYLLLIPIIITLTPVILFFSFSKRWVKIIMATFFLISLSVLYMIVDPHLHETYDYEDIKQSTKHGRIEISTRGTWYELDHTEYKGPYVLFIEFNTEAKQEEDIIIKLIDLHTQTKKWTGEELLLTKNEENKTSHDWSQWYTSGFNKKGKTSSYFKDGYYSYLGMISGIYSDHEPIHITFDLHFRDEIKRVTKTLNPKYKKEYKSRTFEAIMGI